MRGALTSRRGTGSGKRRRLVRELESQGRIRTAAVRDAFLAVPREAFVGEFAASEGLAAVYRDEVIVTKVDPSGIPISSSSQPAIMAEMLEQLALEPGMRVLEIGAGTGYNAALLSELVGPRGSVTTVDVDPEIARGARAALRERGYRVRVVTGDGREGVPDRAPFDRIVATASSDTVPHAWFEQLADDGLVELPLLVTRTGTQVIPTLRKSRRRLLSVAVVLGGFMPLRSRDGPAPAPKPPRCLTGTDTSDQTLLRQLCGDGLATLSIGAKRRLLALALTEGRRHPLGLRADPEALMLYLALALPVSRVVTLFPGWTIGLITRDGRSLAYVEARLPLGSARIGSLTAHGDDAACEALREAVRTWDRRGRPGPQQLEISAAYRDGQPHVRRRWKAAR